MLPVNQCQDKWVFWDNVLEVPANPQILTTEKLCKINHAYCYLSHRFQDTATVTSLNQCYSICFLATIFTPSVSVLSALSNCEVENCLTLLFKSVYETLLNVKGWQACFLLCICDFLKGWGGERRKSKTKPKPQMLPASPPPILRDYLSWFCPVHHDFLLRYQPGKSSAKLEKKIIPMSHKIKTEYTTVKQNTLCWVMPVCCILHPIT